MVYDARLFQRSLEDPAIYTDRYQLEPDRSDPQKWIGYEPDDDIVAESDDRRCGGSRISGMVHYKSIEKQANQATVETKLSRSFSKYSLLLQMQNSIFNDRQDLEALRVGFQRLPNLKRISVLDLYGNFSHEFFPWDNRKIEWFSQRSAKTFKYIISPATWSDVNDERHYDKENLPWDFRGIMNLLTAIKEHAPQLRHLSFGSEGLRLSTAVFSQQEHAQILGKLASQLTSLKIACGVPGTGQTLRRSDFVSAISGIFKEASQLQSLSLTIDEGLARWTDILHAIRIPSLRKLDLGDGIVTWHSFRDLVMAHRKTLLELTMRGMHIVGGNSWWKLAEELGPHLRLHFVALFMMSDSHEAWGSHRIYHHRERLFNTATAFMQQTPQSLMMAAESRRGVVMAWNSKEFRPDFDLEGYCKRYLSLENLG